MNAQSQIVEAVNFHNALLGRTLTVLNYLVANEEYRNSLDVTWEVKALFVNHHETGELSLLNVFEGDLSVEIDMVDDVAELGIWWDTFYSSIQSTVNSYVAMSVDTFVAVEERISSEVATQEV